MPIYEYQCKKCQHLFEVQRKIDERDDPQNCPECGAAEAERHMGGFTVPKHRDKYFKSQVEWKAKIKKTYYPGASSKNIGRINRPQTGAS